MAPPPASAGELVEMSEVLLMLDTVEGGNECVTLGVNIDLPVGCSVIEC